ncbi:hypothetical protein [Thioalbus denitrificans]|uniref:Uncharacterized protein n=1 Tax=Thioalbus denitrificans TaxID=547122 RepID=A0A369C9I7_9GAMM|nr:hypothetical protein [Thioalbus denitrificans]RCX30181.1 hypothetical protein DFQ59_10513 [Thioalbus denitrificans]
MSDEEENTEDPKLPEGSKSAKIARGTLQAIGGAVPFAGGVLSAIAGAWSEGEQEKVNRFFEHWVRMLQDELKEKEETIIEIMARLDLHDEAIAQRVESKEYQSLVKKTFREWSGAESDEKRVYIRNILANAAASKVSSDDVVRMFIDWINRYSEMHFQVIAAIYNSEGITRGEIWRKIGKGPVREDSPDADLYKLLIRDLSTGGIIRQHREYDYYGNPVAKTPQRRPKGSGSKPPVSAFDENEGYDLTGLGQQFIHYAMSDLPLRIEFREETNES